MCECVSVWVCEWCRTMKTLLKRMISIPLLSLSLQHIPSTPRPARQNNLYQENMILCSLRRHLSCCFCRFYGLWMLDWRGGGGGLDEGRVRDGGRRGEQGFSG